MKNKIILSIVIILAIIPLVVIVLFFQIGGAEITEGEYKITDCKDYPDAYIEVKEGKIQFYNIDLNAIYQKGQLESYNRLIEVSDSCKLSEEQLLSVQDLNNYLVENSFDLDYDISTQDNKTGTFRYIYYCLAQGTGFGLVLEYDSLHKTIQINSPVQKLVFER